MLSMKTKKPRNPIVAMPSITLEAGASSPNQPAKKATTNPNHEIHFGTTDVFRIANA